MFCWCDRRATRTARPVGPAGAGAGADPPNRLSALARYGLGTKAPKLERTPEPKRTAMLTAVMRHLEAKAIDDALDLFEILMATRLSSTAKRSTDKQRLSTLPQLERASWLVARVATVVIEELELIEQTGRDVDVSALRRALEEVASRAALSSAGCRWFHAGRKRRS